MKKWILHYILLLSITYVHAQNFPCRSNQLPSTPNLGANLEGIADWSRSNAFVDVVKQGRGFFVTGGNGEIVPLDANKWPMTNFSMLLIAFEDSTAHLYNGTYKMSFTGQATFSYCCAVINVNNIVYNATNNTTTADVIVNAPEPAGGNYMIINFRNTRRTPGSSLNSGITNLKIIRPGYSTIATPTFTTPFLNHLKRFSTLRFMDWTKTNNSTVVNWNDRTQPFDPWQAKENGVAWEYCIELANTLKKDMWINIPHQANDNYITQLATLLKNTLDPNLNVYVEYSNEVWNWGFNQSHWNSDTAAAEVNAGGSNLGNDGMTGAALWGARRIARRTREISNLFAAVWGATAINTRVRPVFCYQLSWPGLWGYPALDWMNANFGDPSKYMYAAAGAPYFNVGDDAPGLTTAQVLDSLNFYKQDLFITASNHFNWMEAGAAMARFYNLKFLSYEGGTDTFGPNNIKSKKDASFAPAMETICTDFLNKWYSYGSDGLINWYTAGATSYDGPYGTWGLTNDMTNQNTPKIRAIDNILSKPAPPITAGSMLSTTTTALVDTRLFVNTNNWGGHGVNWATTDPYHRYLTGGNFDDYLINVPKAGVYEFRVNLNCWRTNTGLRIILNNQLVQNIIVPQTTTPGVDNFQDTAPIQMILSEGLNVIRLYYNFSGRSYDTKYLKFDYKESCDALPLSWLEFSVYLSSNKQVDLKWKTSNEDQCESYYIEKSTDGLSYHTIQKVPALNKLLANYSASDDNPANGTTYYRLKQTNLNGKDTYSPVRTVNIQPLEIAALYPVPAFDHISLSIISSEEREVKIRLVDMVGRPLIEKNVPLHVGANEESLNIDPISPGLYVIQISDVNGKVQHSKQIKIGE